MKTNPFLLIGSDLSDLGQPVLRKLIAEKRKKWNAQKLGSGPKVAEAMENSKALDEAEPLLLEHKWAGSVNEAKFQELVAEARKTLRAGAEAELAERIAFITKKGYLERAEFSRLAKNFAAFYSEAELRGKVAVEIRADSRPAKAPDSVKPMETSTYGKIQESLKLLEFSDLYQFLDGATPHLPEAERDRVSLNAGSSSKALRERANRFANALRRQGNLTAQHDARKFLCGQAQTLFDDKQPLLRKSYQRALDNEKIAFLARSLDWVISDNELSADNYAALLEKGMETGAPRELVETFLAEKIKVKSITLIKPGESALFRQEACLACHTLNDLDAKFCRKCSKPLAVGCPLCNQRANGRDTVCAHCGFPLGEMVNAQPRVREAQACVERGDFAAAVRLLAQAEVFWPKLEAAQKLRERLQTLEQEKHASYAKINTLIGGGELLAAEAQIRAGGFAATEQKALGAEVAKQRKQAEDLCRAAREKLKARQEKDALELLRQALASARDLPEVKRLAAEFAPAAPQQPTATLRGSAVHVRWLGVASELPLQYLVLRRDLSAGEAAPQPLGAEMSGTSYDDTGVRAGHTYQYFVVSRRMEISSSHSPASENVTATDEVRGLQAAPGKGCLNLQWEPPEGAVSIRVTRKKGTAPATFVDGEPVKGVTLRAVTDEKLVDGETYAYRVGAVFASVQGAEVVSVGVTVTAKIQTPPSRIERLFIHCVDGKIEASWTPPDCGRPHLLLIQGKAPQPGTVLSLAELEAHGRKMPLESSGAARFDSPGAGALTFMVFSERDGIVVAGAADTLTASEEKQAPVEISFKLSKRRLLGRKYQIELASLEGSFLTPELAVYYGKQLPPRLPSEGHLLLRVPPFKLGEQPRRIELDGHQLSEEGYINVLVINSRDANRFRILKPGLDNLRVP